jgi:phage replication-related protein YjqB (UPF0714/DUF867 family)
LTSPDFSYILVFDKLEKENKVGGFIKVKELGCVPLEVFPPGFRIPRGDGTFINAAEVPTHMVLKMSDASRNAIIEKMKRMGVKLVDETQVIGGRTFKVERRLDGSILKTEVPKPELLTPYFSKQPVLSKKQRKKAAAAARRQEAQRTYSSYTPQRGVVSVRDWYNSGGQYHSHTPHTLSGIIDKYKTYAEMIKVETEFAVEAEKRSSGVAVVAIHGGNTEPVTTELARFIAGTTHSYYSFLSKKPVDNADMHVTSSKWEDPVGLGVVRNALKVISLHGAGDLTEKVFLGGLDKEFGLLVQKALEARGFVVEAFNHAKFAGDSRYNIANRGATGQGLQIEVSRGLRMKMFEGGLTDRTVPTELFHKFAEGILEALSNVVMDYTIIIKKGVERWTVAQGLLDNAKAEFMDFVEDIAVDIEDQLESVSDEEFQMIYEGLESGDESMVNLMDEKNKAKYNLLAKQKQEAEVRVKRIGNRIKRLVEAHVDSVGSDSLEEIKELVKDIIPIGGPVVESKVDDVRP